MKFNSEILGVEGGGAEGGIAHAKDAKGGKGDWILGIGDWILGIAHAKDAKGGKGN